MKIREFLSEFCAFSICLVSVDSSFAAKRQKKKPGVVLKSDGYYCPIEKADKVIVKSTTEIAVAIATQRGFIAPEEHFRTLCETPSSEPHVLQPSAIVSFDFGFAFDGDKASTSKLRFSKGTYKATLSCPSAHSFEVKNPDSIFQLA